MELSGSPNDQLALDMAPQDAVLPCASVRNQTIRGEARKTLKRAKRRMSTMIVLCLTELAVVIGAERVTEAVAAKGRGMCHA